MAGPGADPVAAAADGFLEILAFDAYCTARGVHNEPGLSRRVAYVPRHTYWASSGPTPTAMHPRASGTAPAPNESRHNQRVK